MLTISDPHCLKIILLFRLVNCRFLDPIIYGEYPPEIRQVVGSRLPVFTMEEREILRNSVDFIGINHYTTLYAKDCMLTPCNSIYSGLGDALVYLSGDRDGILIGEPVSQMCVCVCVCKHSCLRPDYLLSSWILGTL